MADHKINLQTHFHIGRIVGAHGLAGEVKVQVLSSDEDRFQSLTDCLLTSADEKSRQTVTIENSRRAGKVQLIKLAGFDDRTAAEKLRGCFLSVDREHALVLTDDEYFISDLIGCQVYDHEHGYLGHVADILTHQAQDIYVIRHEGDNDLLFPAIKAILRRIDLEQRRIDVNLLAGLYELYRERKS